MYALFWTKFSEDENMFNKNFVDPSSPSDTYKYRNVRKHSGSDTNTMGKIVNNC